MPSAPLTAQLDTDTSKNLTMIAQLMVTLLVVQIRQNILRCSQKLLCPSNLGVPLSATCLCSALKMLRREPPQLTPVQPSSCSFLELVLRPCIAGQLPPGHLRIRPNCCVLSHVVLGGSGVVISTYRGHTRYIRHLLFGYSACSMSLCGLTGTALSALT